MKGSDTNKLSLSIVEDLKGKGYSQSEIAEMYGVTRQYVSWLKHNHGGRLTPTEIVLKEFPWHVPAKQSHASAYRRLRDHAEFVATGGVGMSEEQLSRLRGFYRKLREGDLVVEFDPDIPPEAGVSTQGGWAYRPRRKQDGELIIRRNEYTNVTDKGKMIWRFQPIEP